jgi:hypothetical protein
MAVGRSASVTGVPTGHAAELVDINRAIQADPNASLNSYFADWPIEDFGALYLADLADFPELRSRLPKMPAPEIQRRFTWWEGAELMRQSVDFARTLTIAYPRWTGAAIKDATVLDYGAGWGRLTRMMLQYVSDDRVYACDAWQESVDIYNSLGFRRPCDLVEAVPTTLPYDLEAFDLVWMFSVLTHLPATAADSVMRALAAVVKKSALVVVTIRPVDFWRANPLVRGRVDAAALVEQHLREGFVHVPHPANPQWGNCSMSVDYIAERWSEWRLLATEDNWTHQVKVFLQRSP